MILNEEKELLFMLELKLFDDDMCFHKYTLSGKTLLHKVIWDEWVKVRKCCGIDFALS